MMRDFQVYGCDTETYSEPSYGLKSIQIWHPDQECYITADDYNRPDNVIRSEICHRFVIWLQGLEQDAILAWFNLTFDLSQFVQYLVCDSSLSYSPGKIDEERWGTVHLLETPMKAYTVEIMNSFGVRIKMIDIANFLTATNLNKACLEWCGERKNEVATKRFPKSKPTETERAYAMNDARITQHLMCKLMDEQVIEGAKYSTIAGRTMGHFKDYLKAQWGLTFNQWIFPDMDEEEIAEAKRVFELMCRPSGRGGYCYAFRKGIFEHCHHVDARSMYPSAMVSEYIPYGMILTEKPEGPHFSVHFPTGRFRLKPEKVPYFQFRTIVQCERYAYEHPLKPGEMNDSVWLDGSYMLWDNEYQLIQDLYECDIDSDTVYYFKAKENRALKSYVEMLYKGKMENTGTKRNYYKILLNSLYGKFLSRPDGEYVDYTGKERHTRVNDDRAVYYFPLGSWIAKEGRVRLCRAMSSIDYKDLIYCDTDSIVFTGDRFPDITIGKYLNQWGIENDDFRMNCIGPKTYQEVSYDGSNIITKCAGLSREILNTIKFGELAEGKEYVTLKSRRDPTTWAINLIPTTHKVQLRTDVFGRFNR